MKKNIYIVGAGAIGRALAVLLELEGAPVTLLRGSADDLPAYSEQLQVLLENWDEKNAEIGISTISHFNELNGIVVIASKSYGNRRLAQLLANKTGSSPIVILQNGLNVEQPFIDGGFSEIYRCVLFVTSQVMNNGKVRFKPVSASPIGIVKGDETGLQAVVESLNSPHFGFRAENDIRTVIWRKAVINCVFNSVCPLLETDNGIFHRNGEALAIARRVIAECIGIAALQGITLQAAEVEENLLQISRSSDGQQISTLQDILHKRETEIDTLNAEIARIAASLGKENEVTETRLLGGLTALKSALNRQKI
ncbi:ketopantoate reductase family protein [Chitinophaga sp. GCM10012297]|uniref:2-dehydropantoate 2-reductase n=1 Tax=Chitinophaga chungangae TaxID=2821488 RepID=A0ABS3YAB9_9BACT|nr:2-dehydropantoate 2-reductase [Chitinophaga chungangae]MBO9151625.1 2-dehydropantoate 2-reductase [Chitinophaga chungangae]